MHESTEPGQHREAVDQLPALVTDPASEVVGEPQHDQAPSGDDPDRGGQRLVGENKRHGHIDQAGMQELVTDQRQECRTLEIHDRSMNAWGARGKAHLIQMFVLTPPSSRMILLPATATVFQMGSIPGTSMSSNSWTGTVSPMGAFGFGIEPLYFKESQVSAGCVGGQDIDQVAVGRPEREVERIRDGRDRHPFGRAEQPLLPYRRDESLPLVLSHPCHETNPAAVWRKPWAGKILPRPHDPVYLARCQIEQVEVGHVAGDDKGRATGLIAADQGIALQLVVDDDVGRRPLGLPVRRIAAVETEPELRIAGLQPSDASIKRLRAEAAVRIGQVAAQIAGPAFCHSERSRLPRP